MHSKLNKFEKILLRMDMEKYRLQDNLDGIIAGAKPNKRFADLTLHQSYLLLKLYDLFVDEREKEFRKFFNAHALEIEECVPFRVMQDLDWYFANIKELS